MAIAIVSKFVPPPLLSCILVSLDMWADYVWLPLQRSVDRGETDMGLRGTGGSLEPAGPLLTRLHTASDPLEPPG